MAGVVSAPAHTRPLTHRRVLLAGFATGALAIAALVAIDPTALCLLPALALAVPLLMRRYPGERAIAVLSGARRRRRWARPRASARASAPKRRGSIVVGPRGALLLACSLAVRPPPLWLSGS